MKKIKHKWMITYDDCKEIRNLFSFANIINWEFQYGMNNYKQNSAAKGKELIITNYDIPNKKIIWETDIIERQSSQQINIFNFI